MSPPNLAVELPVPGSPEDVAWTSELAGLLSRAAAIASAHAVDSESFMNAAWNACLDATPGLREELANKQLRAQLKKLRKQGLIAVA